MVRRRFVWMLAPALAFVVVMVGFPFAYTLYLSGFAFHFGATPRSVGLGNYRALLVDPEFWNGLWVTLYLYLLALVAQLVLGFYLALLLNRTRRFRRVVRSVLISPFVLPPVVVGLMWLVILDPSIGAANYLLTRLGLPPSLWLASPGFVIPTVALIDTWQWTPFIALILLAGLQALPDEVFEAAAIDGAHGMALLRRVTLPLLAPSIVTAATLRSVDLLRFFDVIYVTTQGGPGIASETLNIYGFRQGFVFLDIGYACALMVALTLLVLLAVGVLARMRRVVAW